jgi:hypothetical protein
VEPSFKKCFIISPIGAENSPIREHADDVFDYIIKPACERTGYEPVRSDQMPGYGSITESMFDAILGSDLLIGVLTSHNPNVFYEVAVAQSAARPIVLMMDRKDPVPFDINTIRIILYDLKPRPLMTGVYRDLLTVAIEETERTKGARRVPFNQRLKPLGSDEDSVWRVLERTELITAADRVSFVNDAVRFLNVSGLALFAFAKTPGFHEAIEAALGRGVHIRALLMDPSNPALPHQLRVFTQNYLNSVVEEIRGGIEFWEQALARHGSQLRLHRQGVMYCTLLQNDARVFCTPYTLSAATSEAIAFHAPSNSPIYQSASREFRFMWDSAATSPAPD